METNGRNERLERLYARRTFGIKPGLDEIRALLRELGDPQESFRVLHWPVSFWRRFGGC